VRPEIRSRTSICLKIVDPWFTALEEEARKTFVKTMTGLLDKENVAKDIASYVTAPAGLRIWGGATD
jgi:phosphoserine aminotransferase